MIPSVEYRNLIRRQEPATARAGDMWLCRRIGMVIVALGVRRKRGVKHTGQHFMSMYNWQQRRLEYYRSDFDPNDCGSTADSFRRGDERWEYLGNMFEMLPYSDLASLPPSGGDQRG